MDPWPNMIPAEPDLQLPQGVLLTRLDDGYELVRLGQNRLSAELLVQLLEYWDQRHPAPVAYVHMGPGTCGQYVATMPAEKRRYVLGKDDRGGIEVHAPGREASEIEVTFALPSFGWLILEGRRSTPQG